MTPIDNDDYLMLVKILTDYIASLATISEFETGLTEDGKDHMEHAEAIKLALLEQRYIVMDTRPRCMVMDEGTQCKATGRYQPYLFVYAQNQAHPMAQLAVTPPVIMCEAHAVGGVDKFLSQESWRDIQAQVCQQAPGTMVSYDDCQVMYLDTQTNAWMPPPSKKVIIN